MVRKRKTLSHKVGQSYLTFRKVDGKRRKVKITRLGIDKERVRIVGAKRR